MQCRQKCFCDPLLKMTNNVIDVHAHGINLWKGKMKKKKQPVISLCSQLLKYAGQYFGEKI